MNEHVWSVLLAGGVGSRFWPVSRAARPKQLLDLFGEGPMLRATLDRARPLAPPERTLVVTSETLAKTVREMMPEVPADQVLAEPSGKNTAPAIAWAAKVALDRDPDAILMVLPSDHHISRPDVFRWTARQAIALADSRLVTIGIVPTHPETGYGYIEVGASLADLAHGDAPHACEVARFSEKPDLETAIAYLASERHLWNAGMFFMSARLYLDELGLHRPALGRVVASSPSDLRTVWSELESVSIDYAVMEHSQKVAVVPGDFGWSDVGSWSSLFDHRHPGLASFHSGEVIELDGSGNVLFADGGVVATLGVSDLIVVHTADATFVAPRAAAQRAREIVTALDKKGRKDLL